MEAPLLETQIWKTYQNEGVIVLGLGLYSSMAPANAWRIEHGLTYLLGIDNNSTVWNEYGQGYIPHNIVIGQSMNVLYTNFGSNVNTIESWVNTELNKAPTAPTGLAVTGQEPTALLISWDPNIQKDVAGYELSYSAVTNGKDRIVIDVGNTTNYHLQNLALFTTYELTLKAYDMRGYYSTSSAPINGATVGNVPSLSFVGIACLLLMMSGLFLMINRKKATLKGDSLP